MIADFVIVGYWDFFWIDYRSLKDYGNLKITQSKNPKIGLICPHIMRYSFMPD